MTFPPVGVTAVIAGMAVFNRDAAIVESRLLSIQRVARRMETESGGAAGAAASAFTGMASAVTTAAVVVGGAVALAGAASIKFAADFEQSLALTQALTGATDEEMAGLETTITSLARQGTLGMGDLSKAATELARAGVPIPDIMNKGLKAVQDLTIASGGEIGLAPAAKLVATSMNAFGLSVEEVDRVTGAATVVAQNSALTFTDFGTAVQYSAPAFKAAGFTIEDLALATALLGKNGVTGSVAATSLRGVIQRLIRPSKDAQEVMDKYGISLFDANGNARTFDAVLAQLNTAFSDEAVQAGKLTEEQRLQAISTLGLQRTGAAFLILANATTEQIEELRGSFERLQVTQLVDQLLKPLNAQMGIAWNNVQVLAYAFGKTFVEALGPAANQLVTFLQGLKEADFTAAGQQVIDFGRTVLDAIGVAIQNIKDFAEAFGLVEPAIELLKNAAIGLGAIIAGNIVVAVASALLSFGAFILAVGLVTTAILKLIDYAEKAGVRLPTIGEILDAIGKKLAELGDAWAPWAAEAGMAGKIVEQALVAVSGVVETLQFILQGNYTAAAESAAKATGHFGEALDGVLQVITPVITAISRFTGFLVSHLEILVGVAAGLAVLKIGLGIAALVGNLALAFVSLSTAIAASGGVIAAIVAVLGGPFTIALVAIAVAVGVLTAAWIGNWGDIQGKTAAVVAGIGAFFSELGTEMRIVQAGVGVLAQLIGQAWETLKSQTTGAWLAMQQAVQQAFINMDAAIAGAGPAIVSAVTSTWNDATAAIGNALLTAYQTVTTWINNVIALIRGMAGTLLAAGTEAGRAVVQGLSGAITNGIAEVGRAATNLALGVLNSAKAALDSRSPSKKFQDLGEDVVEGFQDGIEENSYDVIDAGIQIAANLEWAVVQRLEEAKRPIRGTAASLVDDIVGEMYEILGKVDQLGIDMQAKMSQIGEEVGRKINETIMEAADAIADVIADTNERIQDMIDNLARARDERGLRADLTGSQEARRSEFKDAQDAKKRRRKEQQEDEDAAKDAVKSRAELEAEHAKALSDSELKRTRDLNEARIDMEDSLQDATDDKQRTAAKERFSDRRADIEREFVEKQQDLARDFELDKAALEAKVKEEEAQRVERRQRQAEDAQFERELEQETNDFERQLEQETQDFNDKLEDEGLQRSIKRAEMERDKRIQSINEAMDEKQRKIREQGEREINELRDNTLRKIDILEKDFALKAADVLKKGGEQMRPLVDNIQEILSGNFAAMKKSAEGFTDSVNNAIGALKRLREERERAEYEAPVLPSPTKGLGQEFYDPHGLPEYQKGGWVDGPFGKPQVAIVHGGEYISGLHTSAAKMLAQMSRAQPSAGDTYNLNLNASYSSYESPADIELDMRAMIAMARG